MLRVHIKLIKLVCYLLVICTHLVVTVAVGSGSTKVEGHVQVLHSQHPLASQSTFVVVEADFTQYFEFIPAPKQYAPVGISAKSEEVLLVIFGTKTNTKELLGSVVDLLILVGNYFFQFSEPDVENGALGAMVFFADC